MKRGRKPVIEPSAKQIEIYEMVLRHVAEFGYQPTIAELAEWLDLQSPAVRGRIAYLVAKGLFEAAPHKSERSLRFVGVRFLPYQVDGEGNPLEGEYTIGEFTVTFCRNGTGT